MSAPRYRISTVADFGKVPPDRIHVCLAEFEVAVELARRTKAALEAIAAEKGVAAQFPLETFEWVDDGERNATISILPPRQP